MTLPKFETFSPPEQGMNNQSAESFDRALLGFVEKLRAAGIRVDQDRIHTSYRSIDALGGFTEPDHLFLAGRLSFCSRKEDLAIYDRVFAVWFGGRLVKDTDVGFSGQERQVAVPGDRNNLSEVEMFDDETKKTATSSEIEILRNADLALLAPSARVEVEDWIARLRPVSHTRRTRRFVGGGGSLIDRRKSVRAALRAGGEFAEIIFRDRRLVPRRVLFLIDISGSMKAYSSAYLRFAHATKRVRSSTEVFTVGTRLTRITRALSGVNVQKAVDQALKEIPDWSGGTRLGTQIREFNREYGARGVARGAIVVIASDGWERGDVSALGDGVAHLARLAKRIIWVNPHLHRPGFAPLTAGMEIALPHVDRLVSGHSYKSFEDLCGEIAG